jgi:outer membrane protein OmpA-like peptidoglycan-associated protein
MTSGFSTRVVRVARAAALACSFATAADAQHTELISMSAPAPAETRVLFFDVQSASLSPVAKSIVLSTVDAAERAHAKRIEIAAYAADDEAARDSNLAARRAEAVKEQIAHYGFEGTVIVDEEGPELPLARLADGTFDRRVILFVVP